MSILRRAATVFARLIAMGRHEEASALQALMPKRKNRRGRKYPPAVQVRGGLCTIGSHDAAVGHVLRKRFGHFGKVHGAGLSFGRCRKSAAYAEKLAELGVRQS